MRGHRDDPSFAVPRGQARLRGWDYGTTRVIRLENRVWGVPARTNPILELAERLAVDGVERVVLEAMINVLFAHDSHGHPSLSGIQGSRGCGRGHATLQNPDKFDA
jgi:hypothetical protein